MWKAIICTGRAKISRKKRDNAQELGTVTARLRGSFVDFV